VPVRPQRVAATWFLAAIGVAVLLLAWLRGAGRFLLPLALVGLVGFAVVRVVRAVTRPLP
jgi:hypothetical protein